MEKSKILSLTKNLKKWKKKKSLKRNKEINEEDVDVNEIN